MSRTIAITGATGFAGRHAVSELLLRGFALRALVRDPARAGLAAGVETVQGDLADTAALARLVDGADAVIHLAGALTALDRDGYFRVNAEGTRALADAAQRARVRRFVHISSLAAREPQLSGYAASKRAGEEIVTAGSRLGGREIAVAAACGRSSLSVSQIPRIAVVATGDELVEVESPVAAHQIRRSNDHAIRAALALAGYPKAERFHLRDLPQEMEHRLWHILAEYEVVILTGGVSKGRFDLLPAELERQGVRKILQGVAQRPGKPLWVGVSGRGVLVFALPGNPVSAYTCLHRYVLPALDRASGLPPRDPRLVPLAARHVFRPKLACLLPVTLVNGTDGVTRAVPKPGNTSGDLAGLVGTDGFVELPAQEEEFPAGTLTPFRAW